MQRPPLVVMLPSPRYPLRSLFVAYGLYEGEGVRYKGRSSVGEMIRIALGERAVPGALADTEKRRQVLRHAWCVCAQVVQVVISQPAFRSRRQRYFAADGPRLYAAARHAAHALRFVAEWLPLGVSRARAVRHVRCGAGGDALPLPTSQTLAVGRWRARAKCYE